MQYHTCIYMQWSWDWIWKGVGGDDTRWKMSALKFVRSLVIVNHLICFRIFIPPRVYSGIVCFPAKFLAFKNFLLQKIFGCYDSLICRQELNQSLSDLSPIIGNACHLLTNSLTHWLTDSCLVNLIGVALACEDDNSKIVEIVTVAHVDNQKHVDNILVQIWKVIWS